MEAARLMGFSSMVNTREDIPVSDAQAYRQFGNAVVPAVVTAVAKPCLPILKSLHEKNLQKHKTKSAIKLSPAFWILLAKNSAVI